MDAAAKRPAYGWLVGLVGCIGVVVVCVAFVDRPVVEYMDTRFRGTPVFAFAAGVLDLLDPGFVLVLLFLIGCGIGRLVRRQQLPAWTALPLEIGLSMVAAVVAALVLKYVVGRSQADPLYLARRAYEFRPFSYDPEYWALPSAAAAGTVAMATVLWRRQSRLRILGVVVVALLMGALVVTNGHWVGDIIGGVFLGAFAGWLVLQRRGLKGLESALP